MRFSLKEAGLLSLVVCAVYANALSGSFHYDDFHSLVQNPHIRDWQRATDFFCRSGFVFRRSGQSHVSPAFAGKLRL